MNSTVQTTGQKLREVAGVSVAALAVAVVGTFLLPEAGLPACTAWYLAAAMVFGYAVGRIAGIAQTLDRQDADPSGL